MIGSTRSDSATPPVATLPSPHDAVLQVRSLVRRYGTVRAVDAVSFELYRGEVLTLLGPSGCGKSTTLRLVAGLERPDDGDVVMIDRVVASVAQGIFVPAERRNIGLVFQSYAVWPHMTVAQNVAYPLELRKAKSGEIRDRVSAVLDWLGLAELAQRPSTQLSGGQQQRVALARALVYEPDILLLDEPLSNLDAKLRYEIRLQLKSLQARLKTTILYVTHDQTEAMSLSHRIAVMRDGRIEQISTPDEIYEHPATMFVQDFVGSSITLTGTPCRTTIGAYVDVPGHGRLAVNPSHVPTDAATVRVSVRPENMRVHAEPSSDGVDTLRAQVDDISYAGSHRECLLRIGEQQFTLDVPRAASLHVGDAVYLSVDSNSVRVWPA